MDVCALATWRQAKKASICFFAKNNSALMSFGCFLVRETTLLDLLVTIEGKNHGRCTEGTLVSTALKLINSGKVKLSGTFANASLPLK